MEPIHTPLSICDHKLLIRPPTNSQYLNYKSLSCSDTPIDDITEEPKKLTANSENFGNRFKNPMAKLKVDFKYIEPLLTCFIFNKVASLNGVFPGKVKVLTRKKRQIFIDLDKTLITTIKSRSCSEDFLCCSGEFVHLRPFAHVFLSKLHKEYDIIVSL